MSRHRVSERSSAKPDPGCRLKPLGHAQVGHFEHTQRGQRHTLSTTTLSQRTFLTLPFPQQDLALQPVLSEFLRPLTIRATNPFLFILGLGKRGHTLLRDFLMIPRRTVLHCTGATLRSDCTHSASSRTLVLVVFTCPTLLQVMSPKLAAMAHQPYGKIHLAGENSSRHQFKVRVKYSNLLFVGLIVRITKGLLHQKKKRIRTKKNTTRKRKQIRAFSKMILSYKIQADHYLSQ